MALHFTTALLLFLSLTNIVAFFMVGMDKRKSVQGNERVPEVFFFVWSIFFASLGVLLGMFVFHHKTRKWYFPFGISILLLEQASLLYFFITR